MIRDVATVRRGTRPGQLDRSTSQRYLSLTANVEGEDMGRASRQVQQAIDAAGTPPRGVRVEPRGQLPPMVEMFRSLGIGMVVAVFVIFVLLTAYFQSLRLSLIAVSAGAGGARRHRYHALLYQHHPQHRVVHGLDHVPGRLGVELGHARDVHRRALEEGDALGRGGRPRRERAAAADLHDRLRDDRGHGADGAGLERGSQMQAPLGLAVIGGLGMSTFATLLVVPAIFAVVIGKRVSVSPSIYPDDPESSHYDPNVYAEHGHSVHVVVHAAEPSGPHDPHADENHLDPNAAPVERVAHDSPGAAPDAPV